jgi:hypothetical protein
VVDANELLRPINRFVKFLDRMIRSFHGLERRTQKTRNFLEWSPLFKIAESFRRFASLGGHLLARRTVDALVSDAVFPIAKKEIFLCKGLEAPPFERVGP